MASSEQPADSWEDLDKLALDKLSLGEKKPNNLAAEHKGLGTSSHEERAQTHEAVSCATAQSSIHSSSSQPIIDPAVRDALINPKYRIQVLRFEADVEKFVRQGDQQDLTFDATLTGYQRLLCHRVAQYYGLDTSTIDEGEDQGKILARRTAVTAIPGVQLAEVKLATDSRDQRRVETPPRVLMKNRAAADRAARAAAAAANGEAAGQANSRTVQEREQDYSKARARIFGAVQSPDASMSPSHSPQIHDSAMRGMMNGSRPQNVGPMGGRGRAPPARIDPGRKAVFRNREQDLQDPDYRRNNPYSCFPSYPPTGYGDMAGMQQTMYIRPTYNSEFPELPGGPMANHSMQGPFSLGPAPHSPAGPPGLMVAGPMPHHDYMHPGGQYIPIPMQMMQGMPYMMGPGGTPMSPLSPGLAMPGAMHPMHSMPGMYPTAPMAFPGMPMAPSPYGFIAPGQEGIPMQMGSPTMYGPFPPHPVMPYAIPAMSLEQQMQQQQQQHQHHPQIGNNARPWPGNNFNRRSSGQQGARSQNTSRPASAAPGATVNKSAQQDSKPPTADKGLQESSVGIASSALTTDSITS